MQLSVQSWQDFNFCHYRRFWVANICTFCLYISYEWYLDWEKEGICITPILSDLYKAWSRFSFKRMPLYCSVFVFKVYMINVFFLNYFLCWCVNKLAIYSLISLVYAKQVYLDFKIDSVLRKLTWGESLCFTVLSRFGQWLLASTLSYLHLKRTMPCFFE